MGGAEQQLTPSRRMVAVALAVGTCSLLLAVMPAAAHRGGAAESSKDKAASHRVNSLTRQLVGNLGRKYQVARGYPTLYTNADCTKYSYPIMRSCFANNPAAPYIFPIVPSWPKEHLDPALRNAFGKTRRGDSATYRLDRREAVVVFGVMPPPARYMGIQTYLATRKGAFDKTSSTYRFFSENYPNFLGILFATIPRDPSRIQSFSSIGNSVNNVVMNRRAGASFGTLKALVITPDRTMSSVVRKQLARVGIPRKDTFTEPIPSKGLRLGLKKRADDFLTVMRYALPDDLDAGDKWRHSLPLSVLRIRERPSSNRKPKRYRPPTLEARSASPEAQYAPDLGALADAVCARWGTCTGRSPLLDGQSPPINAVGPICRTIGMNCLADTQDTTYSFGADHRLDDGEVYAVASTLATETGNATYVGLAINESAKLEGVANIEDTQLKGSASSYVTVPNRDKLYVYYLTRNCAGLETLTEGRCFSITPDMVPPGGSFKLIQRTYIRPGTERGPDSTQLLKPVVIQLARP